VAVSELGMRLRESERIEILLFDKA